jgi:hypothetical protein
VPTLICFFRYIGGGTVEPDIYVVPSAEGNGLASHLSALLVRAAFEAAATAQHGVPNNDAVSSWAREPVAWTCDETNLASRRLAAGDDLRARFCISTAAPFVLRRVNHTFALRRPTPDAHAWFSPFSQWHAVPWWRAGDRDWIMAVMRFSVACVANGGKLIAPKAVCAAFPRPSSDSWRLAERYYSGSQTMTTEWDPSPLEKISRECGT